MSVRDELKSEALNLLIKQIRCGIGLTDLSIMTCVSRQTILNILKNRGQSSLSTLGRVISALKSS